jgi:hypothetical protein
MPLWKRAGVLGHPLRSPRGIFSSQAIRDGIARRMAGPREGPKILTLQMLFRQRLFFEEPLRAAFTNSQAHANSMRPG